MIINDMPGGSSLSAAGSATQPVYIDSNGAAQATTYALNKTVPSDAKFTDTTYSAATTSAAGLMSAADKTKLNGIATGATAVTTSTVSGWGYTKNTGTVTSVSGSGVLSGTVTSSGSITHNTSGVTAGTYGSSTTVPIVTVNDTGHITSVSTQTIGGVTWTLAGSFGCPGGSATATCTSSTPFTALKVAPIDGSYHCGSTVNFNSSGSCDFALPSGATLYKPLYYLYLWTYDGGHYYTSTHAIIEKSTIVTYEQLYYKFNWYSYEPYSCSISLSQSESWSTGGTIGLYYTYDNVLG